MNQTPKLKDKDKRQFEKSSVTLLRLPSGLKDHGVTYPVQ